MLSGAFADPALRARWAAYDECAGRWNSARLEVLGLGQQA